MFRAIWKSSLVLRSLTTGWTRSSDAVLRNALSTAAAAPRQTAPAAITFLRLNNLHDNPGAVKKKRRVGRGVGSSKGKTCGRGHKGQKARSGGSIPPLFEGGQTKFYKLLPKRGFNNAVHEAPMLPLNLGTVQDYIEMGRIDASKTITLRELQLAGLFKANRVTHGVKLLADGKERIQQPLRIHISRASTEAIECVEKAGGQVTTFHYNSLALRSILRPQKFSANVAPIRHARPPPKWQAYYTSWEKRGYLNPAVQMRAWFPKQEEQTSSPLANLRDKFEEILAKKKEALKAQKSNE